MHKKNSAADRGAIFVQILQLGSRNGASVAIKDCIDIAGYPTHAGSRTLADAPVAVTHATVVQSLLNAGCRIVGKTNMHELAYGITGVNHWTGTPINPCYPDRVPGGSSSGSAAAVAGNWVDFAIGTDTGGSIRVPAACCGIYGLKPTFGRISRTGALPAHSTLDCIGPFGRDLATIERAMGLMDSSFVAIPAATSVRLGVLKSSADATVQEAVRDTLSTLPATNLTLPLDDAFNAALTIIGAEAWAAFGHLTASNDMGEDVRVRLLAASRITPAALVDAEHCRERFCEEVDRALRDVDALVLPTLPTPPLFVQDANDATSALRMTALTRPFNLSGHPALSIPLETAAGLPVGLQLVGHRGMDENLCAVARYLIDNPK
jgi:amidase